MVIAAAFDVGFWVELFVASLVDALVLARHCQERFLIDWCLTSLFYLLLFLQFFVE